MTKDQAGQLMKWATRASVSVAATLVCVKGVAWWLSGSVSMLGSLADSTLDMLASLVTLFAVRTALLPPDDDHRFGHGKAEALAGLFQAAIMTGSAVFLLLESADRIWKPETVSHTNLVIIVSIVAIVLSLLLVAFQAYVVKKTGSIAIAGDHLHYKGDLLLNLSVVLAAMAAATGMDRADGILGAMIACYIVKGAYDVAGPAIDMLMDKEFTDEERETIFNIVLESPDVLGLHELKTRSAGRDRFIQMHIEVDGNMTVERAHFIADEVEATLGERFPDTEILIHIDPPAVASVEMTADELPVVEDH